MKASKRSVSHRASDDWLAVLGHELRNPLAPILAVAQHLRGETDGWLADELEVIERQAIHMNHVIENVLLAARTPSHRRQLVRRPVDLIDVVSTAREMTAPLCLDKEQHVSVSVPEGLVVSGDQSRLVQAVSNLLMNAARYTGHGGHITVRAYRDRGFVVLSVSDDGIGISRALLPRLFDPFRRGPRARQHSLSGCGLGLTIARELVTLHGGTLSASSPGLGLGATFTIRLPARARASRARPGRAGALG